MANHDLHLEEHLGKAYDGRLMRRLLGYLKPHRRMALVAVVLIIISSCLQLVGPLATAVALDLYILPVGQVDQKPSPASVWVERQMTEFGVVLDPSQGLTLMAAIFLTALGLTFVSLYSQGFIMQLMGQFIMQDLRRDIFRHLQRLDVSYFDRNPIGRLVTRVTNDVDALNEMFTAGLVAIIGDLVLLFGIVSVLFWLDWRLAIVTFAILPLLLLLALWFRKRARASYREVRIKLARINAFLQEHISGMSVIQLFNQERQTLTRFSEVNERHREANVRAIFYYAVYYPAVELITAVGIGLILWYGGGRHIAGAISIGALIAFLQYAQRFYLPLSDLSEKYNILQSAMASSERVFSLLDTQPEITSPFEPYCPDSVRGKVEFEDVGFSYDGVDPVLQGISFDIQPGETVAVVGHTGAGKSTLANLLLRFYDVQQGSIRVDGVDVRKWDLTKLRRSIGLVLQDVFLFSGSVGDNIRLGEKAITDDQLQQAAAEVHALPFIKRLPQRFQTELKERGAGLSVGQKQLIAFARALAFDPTLLILDEATSSIDTETEQWIQRALERLLEGRTSLVIAHRLSTIQKADRILVMHKGELREQGTHQSLLALKGIYYRLYELQYRREALEVG